MEVRVLGPVTVKVAGERVPLTARKERALLTTLALEVGTTVAITTLIDALWGDAPPATAVRSLRSHVSRLRRRLPALRIAGDGQQGYRLDIPRDAVDAAAVQDLLSRAAAAPQGADRVALLADALNKWRGQPLLDLADGVLRRTSAAHLAELHRQVLDGHATALIDAGRAAEAVLALRPLVVADPLCETRWATLIDALCAVGRTAEALSTFQQARKVLREELGADPGEVLREAQLHALAATASSGARPGGL